MSKSVCIVGAGPAGLVTAKTLLHNGLKGEFTVTIYETQHAVGGLWPTSKADTERQVHPLMIANQSRHTMHFSDMAWESDAPQYLRAWQLGQYLEKYHQRYLSGHPDFELKLNTRVTSAAKHDDGSVGWRVTAESESGQEVKKFDYLVVASGYFGKPVMPPSMSISGGVPTIHSSHYRDLKSLLTATPRKPGKILVVGGQMSGVEIAATIATHLSSEANSPGSSEIPDVDKYSVHHVIQKPIWVFPLFTSPDPKFPSAPFLPLDYAAYNRSNRPPPLVDTSGHISEETAKIVNGLFGDIVGTDQSEYSQLLKIDDDTRKQPPYIAVSDYYADFVRSGLITLSSGKVSSVSKGTATILPNENKLEDIAAVVVATGFDPTPCVQFLPEDVLDEMHYSSENSVQALALGLHSTYHPKVPNLGFVGFYRAAYWGTAQMQARVLTTMWSDAAAATDTATERQRSAEALRQKLQADRSIERTLALRGDPRCSQFPMGDYQFHMQDLAEAVAIDINSLSTDGIPNLSRNNRPLDMLTPSRYPAPTDTPEAREEADKSLKDAKATAINGLTSTLFVARAVFRSLLGTWKLERDLTSKLPSHPSGHFSGTAQFLLRELTSDGLQCAADPSSQADSTDAQGMEYLYIEDGEFKTDTGFGFRATRRYIYRYDEKRDVLSVWFTKPEDEKRADYLFHEIQFAQPGEDREQGWGATAGHLCIDDYYDVKYGFAFKAVNLANWSIEYTVKGPKKDYTIKGTYTR